MEKQQKDPTNNGLMDALQLINAKGDPQELQHVAEDAPPETRPGGDTQHGTRAKS